MERRLYKWMDGFDRRLDGLDNVREDVYTIGKDIAHIRGLLKASPDFEHETEHR